jgi:hypothetical protein
VESNRLKSKSWLLLVAAAVIVGGATAQADTVVGVFSDPALTGFVANDPNIGDATFFDNSAVAPFFITYPNGGSSIQWGWNPSPPQPANTIFSQLDFVGATIPADPTQQFQLGTISYLNGTSSLNTLIFGVTLSFYKNSVDPANFMGSDQVIITTTSNHNLDLAQDADYLNICGNNSNICGSSLQAFEDTNPGVGALTVNLLGTIIGDPQVFLEAATLPPGQENVNGVIGSEAPVPEPATLVMMSTGLVLFGLIRRRAGRPV